MRCVAASIIHNGVLGGALYLDGDGIMYATNKLTEEEKCRRLVMPYGDIERIEYLRAFIFPTAEIKLKDSDSYSFIVFCMRRFKRRIFTNHIMFS